MDAADRGNLLNKLADLIERDALYLAVSCLSFSVVSADGVRIV